MHPKKVWSYVITEISQNTAKACVTCRWKCMVANFGNLQLWVGVDHANKTSSDFAFRSHIVSVWRRVHKLRIASMFQKNHDECLSKMKMRIVKFEIVTFRKYKHELQKYLFLKKSENLFSRHDFTIFCKIYKKCKISRFWKNLQNLQNL